MMGPAAPQMMTTMTTKTTMNGFGLAPPAVPEMEPLFPDLLGFAGSGTDADAGVPPPAPKVSPYAAAYSSAMELDQPLHEENTSLNSFYEQPAAEQTSSALAKGEAGAYQEIYDAGAALVRPPVPVPAPAPMEMMATGKVCPVHGLACPKRPGVLTGPQPVTMDAPGSPQSAMCTGCETASPRAMSPVPEAAAAAPTDGLLAESLLAQRTTVSLQDQLRQALELNLLLQQQAQKQPQARAEAPLYVMTPEMLAALKTQIKEQVEESLRTELQAPAPAPAPPPWHELGVASEGAKKKSAKTSKKPVNAYRIVRFCEGCQREKKRVYHYRGAHAPFCNGCNQHWRRFDADHTCAICERLTAMGASSETRGERKRDREAAAAAAAAAATLEA